MDRPCGVEKIPIPGKDFRPMRREANVWPSNGLTGAMTEYRQVQDFGAPNGWPPSAPASAARTASAADPSRASMDDNADSVAAVIGRGMAPRKNPTR